MDSVFLLILGTDADTVLAREEFARSVLDDLIERSQLTGYQALSRFVPSQGRQQASEQAYDLLLDRQLDSFYRGIGFESATSAETAAAIRRDTASRLLLEDWLESDQGRRLGFLWLGLDDGIAASVIQLQGVADSAEIGRAFAAVPYADAVDQRSSLSQVFAAYRARISLLLCFAYVVVLLLLSIRYGLGGAILVLIPPVSAGLLALTIISLLGFTINLFNILAVILVLGIGVDFSLFSAETNFRSPRTMFAISLAAATTLLSFGLLSLSTTYAVRSFGMTVLIGIALAYGFAPLAGFCSRTSNRPG
jgi:predicted exporter